MKKSTLIFIFSILLLQSCGTSGGDDNASKPQEEITPTTETEKEGKIDQTESDLVGASSNQASGGNLVPSGLIPSVNPQTRQKQINKGKTDPFAPITLPPVITPESEIGSTRGISGTSPRAQVVSRSQLVSRSQQDPYYNPKSKASKYCNPEGDSLIAQPNEARAVLVSGILDVQGRNLAIIKTSEYDYSYTVAEGSLLYGGDVLVKQIDLTSNNPFVILEQYGKEVMRRVVQQPEASLTAPLGSDGFGRVRGLILVEVEPQEIESSRRPIVQGVLCNDNDETIRISSIDIQVEDKKTSEIISSLNVNLGTSYNLKPGQKGIFDGTIGGDAGNNIQREDQLLGLRGRSNEDLNFVMVDWR